MSSARWRRVSDLICGAREIQAALLPRTGKRLTIGTVVLDGPREDEILVRLVASGICHTDTSLLENGAGTALPAILGHEGAGVVEDTGSGVTEITRGDHVVLSYQSCGQCEECMGDHPAGCALFWELNFGFARLDGTSAYNGGRAAGHFFGQSSFATHTLSTVRNTVKVPKEFDLSFLAPLGCGMQTGAGTVFNILRPSRGDGIAVFGTGSVGLAAVMASRVVGADPIVAIDSNPSRLDLAEELGATHVVHGQMDSKKTDLSRLLPRSLEYAIDTTGEPGVIHAAAGFLRKGGILALLAGNGGPGSLPGGRQVRSVIQGDAIPQTFIPFLISLYKAGRFPLNRLLTFYSLFDINKAIKDSAEGRVVKPVILMA
jgi:aryl-alcohol dehydrogenase